MTMFNKLRNVFFLLFIMSSALATGQDAALLRLGLHRSHVETFLEHAKPPPAGPSEAPIGETGICQMVSKGEPPEQDGLVLGFEPLVYDQDLSCSWLCNGLEQLCMDDLNIAPNAGGFLETYEDAVQCVEHISSPEVGAEPGVWLPWLVVRYSCDPK
jgi:hypothetical protein